MSGLGPRVLGRFFDNQLHVDIFLFLFLFLVLIKFKVRSLGASKTRFGQTTQHTHSLLNDHSLAFKERVYGLFHPNPKTTGSFPKAFTFQPSTSLSWGEPTRTLVPWRQGFRHPTEENKCVG
jgi:hypothetical protein